MQCDYFDAGRCRSCTLMGVPYGAQLAEKQRRAAEVLGAHVPGRAWSDPVRSPESHYRNKAKLVVGGTVGRPTLGILDERGRGVDLRRCGLYEPGLAATFDPLARVVADLRIEPYDVPARRGELKYVIVTHSPDGEQLVRFVVRSEAGADLVTDALPDVREALPSARVVTVNLHPEHKAVLEGETERVLTAQEHLPMRLPGATLLLGPRSFFQTNTTVAVAMYEQARDWADALDPRTVRDLYCGVGGFALHLAGDGRRVLGVESSPEAVAAAEASRDGAPGEVRFVVGDATAAVLGEDPPDLVVVNPPRRGIGPELAAALEGSSAAHLLYSSCNLESLARDLDLLPSWRVSQGRVADLFPQTRHVETLLLLDRA